MISREESEEEDLLRIETDDEAFEVELRAEALLNAADAHAAATYEAVVWHKLPGGGHGAGADMDGDGAHSIHLRKRRKGVFGVGGYVPIPVAALEPDGVR